MKDRNFSTAVRVALLSTTWLFTVIPARVSSTEYGGLLAASSLAAFGYFGLLLFYWREMSLSWKIGCSAPALFVIATLLENYSRFSGIY